MALPKIAHSVFIPDTSKTIENLVNKIKLYYPAANLDLVYKAYQVATEAHKGQFRKDGSHYVSHPISVAYILADLKLDIYTIVTGLLHDVVEDTPVTVDFIKKEFNETIAFLVDGVSKVSQVNFQNTQKQNSENMRKMVIAMACDVRVILVKLADRLHNMRTLIHLSSEKRIRISQETLDIYAPLASRLGINSIKIELEDLAFKHSDTISHNSLVQKMTSEKTEIKNYISSIIGILTEEINNQMNLKAIITGRPKNLYSIHQKMVTQNLDYNQVYDIFAFRICVNKIEECYKILGVIHSIWKPIPGCFKDYIAIPKKNNYQSLQTTLFSRHKNKRFEVQIRTHDMHLLAERGIAAHWKYKIESWKNKSTVDLDTLKKFNWLQDLVTLHRNNTNSGEFLESMKMNLFDSEIYVFTPNGEVKDFPKGATTIDFAYSIHTNIGHCIVGAKINSRLVPLKYQLQTGDTVEVMTSKTQTPSKEWLKYCITSKAKSKIKCFLKLESRKQALDTGKKILEKALKNSSLKKKEFFHLPNCIKYMKDKGLHTNEELYSFIGYGKILIQEFLNTIIPIKEENPDTVASQSLLRDINQTKLNSGDSLCPVIVDGLNNIMTQSAQCCHPLPGDHITGFISRRRGIIIHRQACRLLLSSDSNRYIDVHWNSNHKKDHKYIVQITIVSHHVPGVLKGFTEIFSNHGINIFNLQVISTKNLQAKSLFSIDVKNLTQLQELMNSLKALKDVLSVKRVM